jgi:N-acetylglucosamine transport system substrate-binding protein
MSPNRAMYAILLLFTGVLSGCDAIRPVTEGGTEKTAEVVVFEGGYGINWHQAMAAQYNAEHPGSVIDLWGDPRVVEKVKPRILRGNPPDLLLVSQLPIGLLIASEKLLAFDDLLDGPAYGSEATWRELFVPGTLDAYTANGKVYAIPSAFGAWACWYDAKLFREHGWVPPTTWSEFEALCEAMNAAGIAPLAYQGKYPIYAWWTFVSLIHRAGGVAAINRINALERDAFRHPDVVRAAKILQEMGQQYVQPGALAMTHTESQLQFVNGNAGMIFCGLWLYNEMKRALPDGFEMRCFTVPSISGGKGNPALFHGEGTEFLFVPTDAQQPTLAKDFARYMVSPENAPSMGEAIGVISPLRGGTPRENVSDALKSALDMIEGSAGIFYVRHLALLVAWRTLALEPAMAELMRGASTPEEFCKALDDGVATALENRDLVVPAPVLYDPTAFGEPE